MKNQSVEKWIESKKPMKNSINEYINYNRKHNKNRHKNITFCN
jgi:hypothetical protein